MNTCRLLLRRTAPPHNICEDCAYDMQNELDDWDLLPIALSY